MNWRPLGSPSPVFFSVTVKPTCSPAETLAASAVLSTSMAPQLTSTVAVSESDPSFVVVTEAVLATSPQSPASVVAITCTEVLAPAARVEGAKTRLLARDRPAGRRRGDRPAQAGRQDVGEGDALGLALAGVRQRDGEPDLVAGRDVVVVGDLLDVDGGAVDVDRGRVGVRAVVGRRHRGGVVDLAAVRLVAGRDHVDGRDGAGREGRRREHQGAVRDRPAGRGRGDAPVEAARQDVAELHALRLARAGVLQRDGEADLLAGRDARGVGRLVDVDRGAAHVDRGRVGVRPVVRGADRGGVVDRAAVALVGRGHHVDRARGARVERGRGVHEVAVRDRPAGRRRGDRPARGRPGGRR